MSLLKCGLGLVLICGLINCSGAQDDDEDDEPEALRLVSKAGTKFARSMYSMLKTSSNDDNLVFSPSSMTLLMAMLRRGASGSSASEIRDTLELKGLPDSTINEGFSEYIQSFPELDDIKYESVQRIYVPYTHRIKPSFPDALLEGFQNSVGVKSMDYSQTAAAAFKMNGWMKQKTGGKVESIILEDSLSATTSLVLVSGVYFKGVWDKTFRVTNRETDVFYSNDTYSTYVPMMHHNGRFKYADLPLLNAEAVAVPFAGERLELIILLPRDPNGLDWHMEARLKNVSFTAIPARMRKRNVNLAIPKFDMETFLVFTNGGPMLQKMGLRSALSRKSPDFGGISPIPGLFVDKVIQKTVFQMTEEGLQGPSEPPTKYKPGREPLTFRANHPFFAYVYDTETKSVLLIVKKVK